MNGNGDGSGNPDSYDWRPIELADAADWAALLVAVQTVDQDWEYRSVQDLAEKFDDPYRDFSVGSVAVYDRDTMVGCGSLKARAAADPVHEMQYHGAVHPAHRGRGLGSRLLDWAETAAVTLHQEHYPDRPLSLSGSCLSSNAEAIALYGARGYHPARWYNAMVRDLTVPLPELPTPAGVEIVGYTPERSADAHMIRNEAFKDHWGTTEISAEGWAHFMEHSVFRPAYSFLAYADGEPLGFIIGHEYDAYAEATGIRDLFIPLLGTLRAGRKRGIGTAHLVRALAEAKAAGFTAASLMVDVDSPTGALGLYERAGFTVEHTSIVQTKTVTQAQA